MEIHLSYRWRRRYCLQSPARLFCRGWLPGYRRRPHRAADRGSHTKSLATAGLLVLCLLGLALSGCAKQAEELRLKSLEKTRVGFNQSGLGQPWDLHYSSEKLALLVGGLQPFIKLSAPVGGLFGWPARLQARFSSFRRAGRLFYFPLEKPWKSGVVEFFPLVYRNGNALEPEFYSVKIQDKKVKLYGLLRRDKRIKIVQTYALHDDDSYVTMRTTVANLRESREPIKLVPGVRVKSKGLVALRPDGRRLIANGKVRWFRMRGSQRNFAWVGRGYGIQVRYVSAERADVTLTNEVELKPGGEITFDHTLHVHGSVKELLRIVEQRFRGNGGIFVR